MSQFMTWRNIRLLLLLAASLDAQTTLRNGQAENASDPPPLKSPSIGYVFDREFGALRPVLGIPGASALGDPLSLPGAIHKAVFSASAILLQAGDSRELWVVDASGKANPLAVPPAPETMAISPTGSYAVLYYKAEQKLEVVSLRGPQGQFTVDLAAHGSPAAMAVNDTGNVVMAAFDSENASELVAFHRNGEHRSIRRFTRLSAMTFLRNGADAIVTDGVEKVVYRVAGDGASTAVTVLATERDGVMAPFAIAPVHDGLSVVIAGAGSAGAVILNAESGIVEPVPCPCSPAGVYPLSERILALTDQQTGTIWLLEKSSVPHRLSFVPSAARTE